MKVLLIRFSSLGDCILLCPLVSHLKSCGVEEVTVVTKNVYAPLLAAADGVDRVVGYEPRSGLRGLWQTARSLRDGGYTVVDAHASARSRTLSRLLGGAATRFDKHYRHRLGQIVFKRPAPLPSMLDQYGALARGAGLPAATLSPGGITVPARYLARASESMAGDGRPYIAIAPGSRWSTKRWPLRNYVELARRLASGDGYRILLMGDGDDRRFTEAIAAEIGGRCLDISGTTGVLEGAAYLSACAGFVGNDSGLTHLAEAVGVPAVVLFGPTVVDFGYAPSLDRSKVVERRLSCRPCSRNGSRPCIRGNRECLAAIGIDTVEAAVRDMVAGQGPRRYEVDA